MQSVKHAWILFLTAPALVLGQPRHDPHHELLYGTWVLDPVSSVFIGRQAPRSQVLSYALHEEGLQATIIFTNADGSEDRISYITGQEGGPTALQGSENFDAVIMESRGPYHATSTFVHAGREIGYANRTISLDGMKMTVEVTRYGNLSSRAIFIKQAGGGKGAP